jgi:hypothetical protein
MSDTAPAFVKVPAARGWEWLARSHAMFARARLYWLLLILGYWMIIITLSLLGMVGVIAATLLRPVFAVGILAAAWSQERGEPPRMMNLFAGFRSNVRALWPLGVVYALGITAALALSAAVDGGVLMRLFLFGEKPAGELLEMPGIESALIVTMLGAVPTLFALWFAPALIVFQDQGTMRALSASLRAAFVNLAPVLVYAMAVFLFWVIVPIVIMSLGEALGGASGRLVGVAIATPITLGVVALTHIADYVIYRDLFHHGETLGPDVDISA